MALRTPPSWLQNGSHPAENDRLSMQAIIATTGIIGTSSLAVTQAGTPGMAVQVATGWGAIVGNFTTNMGVYQFYNDAATQLSVTASNPSNPRIDRVVVTVNDSYHTGATNNVTFTVVAGTPAGSPTAPATPTNSISLATIAVAAGATSILNANITDTRVSVTTNLPVGDLTEVAAGTGITVTSGTGPIPNVALTTPVAVANGGTGITSFGSGVATFLGTPTSANLAAALTDETGSGANVFGTAPTISGGILTDSLVRGTEEDVNVVASAATGTINFDVSTASVWYYTSNATANHTLNFRYSSTVSLNTALPVGDAITLVWLNTNGGTAYYPSTIQIDGTTVTPKVPAAISAGNASSIDAYVFTIIKTAATPTYTVLETQTKFA
jgi:hypothetical protein